MRQALRLAARGRGRTSPNPMVGAVVVKRGRVIGEGFHRCAGTPHAEINALAAAGARAAGADLYVNLEPCDHHGRTPPCTEALIAAGLRRVVVGIVDPNPLVNGVGLAKLRRAGIEVVTGVLADDCARLNEAFSLFIQRRRPHITLKSAITLDGRVAARSGHARWVSGPGARKASHKLRNELDAIIVGSGTALADDPQLDCREVRGGRDPIRVVFDSQLALSPEARMVALVERSSAPTWVICGKRASAAKARALESKGVRVFRVGTERGHVRVAQALTALAAEGVVSALLEGGPTLSGAFWRARCVDRVIAFVAPKLLADPQALPMIAAGPAETMADAVALEDVSVGRRGADIMISGRVAWNDGERT
ncbi:MAG: riboflavin biosynthesis protein RibD [Deltaproteobacteria bacterium]|nr:MAG: riboflavin biosynthesis protein RibD [Pseudomonadota bacterium]PIE66332.1 MAG: riboflavin biosynthesis protein RibD [Deltaproteobacteria bacterium]